MTDETQAVVAPVAPDAAPVEPSDDQIIAEIMARDSGQPMQPEAPVAQPEAPKGEKWDGRDAATTLLSSYGHVPKSVLEKASDTELQQWSSEYQVAETKTKTEFQRRAEVEKQLRDELGRFTAPKPQETPARTEPAQAVPPVNADL